jgi:hypothetical protein
LCEHFNINFLLWLTKIVAKSIRDDEPEDSKPTMIIFIDTKD